MQCFADLKLKLGFRLCADVCNVHFFETALGSVSLGLSNFIGAEEFD